MYAGGEEGFIGIDVSEADDDGLIEKEGFNHSTTAQKLFEMGQTDTERFRAELPYCGVSEEVSFGAIQLEPTEAADIAEVKDLITLLEFQPKVSVAVWTAGGAGPVELAGHAQVNEQTLAGVKPDKDVFSTAGYSD